MRIFFRYCEYFVFWIGCGYMDRNLYRSLLSYIFILGILLYVIYNGIIEDKNGFRNKCFKLINICLIWVLDFCMFILFFIFLYV